MKHGDHMKENRPETAESCGKHVVTGHLGNHPMTRPVPAGTVKEIERQEPREGEQVS